MSAQDFTPPSTFKPDSADLTGERWAGWKRRFQYYLIARDLDNKPGKRQVAILLHTMGEEGIKLYMTFTFAAAVAADEDNGIAAKPAEDKDDLETVFKKFDQHYGCKKYRNVRRQGFLNRSQKEGESIMDFKAD